jgi:prepilin-type processing-associated H-X9-DG protein
VTSLTAPNGNNAGVNLCGYLPGLANVFRFMDGNHPLNTPKNVSASDISFGRQHVGGGNFLFVDGGVRFMSDRSPAFRASWRSPPSHPTERLPCR